MAQENENLRYTFSVDEKGLVKGIENSTKAFKSLDTGANKSIKSLGNMDKGLG